MKESFVKFKGKIDNIRYFKNNYGIILVKPIEIEQGDVITDKTGCATVVGEMQEPIIFNEYIITGTFVDDPKWGKQYKINSIVDISSLNITDSRGQKTFLESLFNQRQVQAMYEAIDNPYEALKNGVYSELVKIKGCGIKTATSWVQRVQRKIDIAKVYIELEQFNLTDTIIDKLLRKYKSPDLIIEKVKKNPYILVSEVEGIGWKTADSIAIKGGINPKGVERISAYISFYLKQEGENGRSWVTCDELLGAILDNIGEDVEDSAITEAIQSMESVLHWNEDKTLIGLKYYYELERKIAVELIRLRNAEPTCRYEDWEKTISKVEEEQGWTYTEEQKNGIKTALDKNVCMIHGLAGSGKTSIVLGMLEVLPDYPSATCALAGRAAARIAETTGLESYTIHRLLDYNPINEGYKGNFTYHDENQLNLAIVIVDEISMIGASLFYCLIRAIPSGSKLIMLGDTGQLEAIGSGNIAYDIIHSGEIDIVELTKIHRQAQDSAIITESHKVRGGEQLFPKDWVGIETRGKLQDLTIEAYSDKGNTFYKAMQAFSAGIQQYNIEDIQLVALNRERGDACVFNLNNAAQELYNPAQKGKDEIILNKKSGSYVLRVGDKVMNVKNNYSTNPPIYNGNIGIIESIDKEDRSLVVNFIDIGKVVVPSDALSGIELGYASTGHKCQGSQFDYVIVAMDYSGYSLLSREWVYTAITRAKKKCRLITQNSALRFAVCQEKVSKKQTYLCNLLKEIANPKLIF